jgi:uncharacterized protein YecE (DUF72 family)
VYPDWRGRVYPESLPERSWLEAYAQRFPTVELNASFYRMPRAATFENWRARVPPGFVFAVKASRFITHIRRLRDVEEPIRFFWSRTRLLGPTLGPVLFQVPPRFRADVPLLRDTLSVLPTGMRTAFEFRDASWWHDDVFSALDAHGAAFVLADRPGWRVRPIVTGGWSYVRFHQGRVAAPDYPRSKLRRWAKRIAALPVHKVFVYMNNDPTGAAVRDATALTSILSER